MTRIAYKTIDGIRFRYCYKNSWNVRYYSFDNERSWHRSKSEAIQQALSDGLLCADNQFYRTYADGRIDVVNAD